MADGKDEGMAEDAVSPPSGCLVLGTLYGALFGHINAKAVAALEGHPLPWVVFGITLAGAASGLLIGLAIDGFLQHRWLRQRKGPARGRRSPFLKLLPRPRDVLLVIFAILLIVDLMLPG